MNEKFSYKMVAVTLILLVVMMIAVFDHFTPDKPTIDEATTQILTAHPECQNQVTVFVESTRVPSGTFIPPVLVSHTYVACENLGIKIEVQDR